MFHKKDLSKPKKILLLLLLLVGTLGANGCGVSTAASLLPTSAIIGPGGGTLTNPTGGFSLTVPPGALVRNTKITVLPLTNPTIGELPTYQLSPDGLVFDSPATVSFTIPQALLAAVEGSNITVGALGATLENNDGTVSDPIALTTTIDATAQTVTGSAQIGHFSVVKIVRFFNGIQLTIDGAQAVSQTYIGRESRPLVIDICLGQTAQVIMSGNISIEDMSHLRELFTENAGLSSSESLSATFGFFSFEQETGNNPSNTGGTTNVGADSSRVESHFLSGGESIFIEEANMACDNEVGEAVYQLTSEVIYSGVESDGITRSVVTTEENEIDILFRCVDCSESTGGGISEPQEDDSDQQTDLLITACQNPSDPVPANAVGWRVINEVDFSPPHIVGPFFQLGMVENSQGYTELTIPPAVQWTPAHPPHCEHIHFHEPLNGQSDPLSGAACGHGCLQYITRAQ